MAARQTIEKTAAMMGLKAALWLEGNLFRHHREDAGCLHGKLWRHNFLNYIPDSVEERGGREGAYNGAGAHGGRLGASVRRGRVFNVAARHLAIRDIGKENADTFRKVQHPGLNSEWNCHGLS